MSSDTTPPIARNPLPCPPWCDQRDAHPFEDFRVPNGRITRTHTHAVRAHLIETPVLVWQEQHLAPSLDYGSSVHEPAVIHLDVDPIDGSELNPDQARELAAILIAAAEIADRANTVRL